VPNGTTVLRAKLVADRLESADDRGRVSVVAPGKEAAAVQPLRGAMAGKPGGGLRIAGHGFGTAPVFLASISTILGAIMFLRFGYAVGHQGLAGALLIVLLGHLVTVPTALAISEIATNRRVEGGGEYFIISRSFGASIGGAIGIALYLSQAISVAFYMIAFAEAFTPLAAWFERTTLMPFDVRYVSLPATGVLVLLILSRGANLGVRALWAVAGVLTVALGLFFAGPPLDGMTREGPGILSTVADPDPFMLVFAICFPAFTGMTAGVGLSGDLANPRRSIPLGVLVATGAGMVVYALIVTKLAMSAPPEVLASDQLVMSQIALWGPIIPIGLACATLSSAIGSILVAPRTLQALGRDRCTPVVAANRFLAAGVGVANEPRNATLVTACIAVVFVAAGNVDFVARIISMFFMVTYGALCLISFLEHFAARPSYRPSFRSRWYLSLVGAVMALLLMFQMDPVYAVLSIAVMIGLYRVIVLSRKGEPDDLAAIMRGVMTQLTRTLQITLQKSQARREETDWRPSLITVTGRSFDRAAPLQLLAWICHRHGFGTYLHYIQGHLGADTYRESRRALQRLLVDVAHRGRGIYVDTMVSPSMRSALAQSLQLPGVSGMENNSVLFEFAAHDPEHVHREILDGCELTAAARMNGLVLRHGEHFFGNRKSIHIWLTWHDYQNAALMILLSYILAGNRDWRHADIRIFAAFPEPQVESEMRTLREMISTGRLPITEKNILVIPTDDRSDFARIVAEHSAEADLAILGYTPQRLREKGFALLQRHPELRDVLLVNAQERILID
jgi:amino acid transporter